MPHKPGETAAPAVPRTYGVQPRCIQTSGIFRLPVELIVEIFTYFGDPRRTIINAKTVRGAGIALDPKHVEWSTIIRRLTMTCWYLRNMLLPLLWEHVEGCKVLYRRPLPEDPGPKRMVLAGSGLYAQCAYLVLNPTIAAYVRTLSVDLWFRGDPRDVITMFIDCLVRLPNLRTLDILSCSHTNLVTRELNECVRLPSIRELGVGNSSVMFIGSCPNVESVESVIPTFGLSRDVAKILSSYGKGLEKLKRVAGVEEDSLQPVAQGCPYLQEICINGIIAGPKKSVADVGAAGHLRLLKRLAVVEVCLFTRWFLREEAGTVEHELRRAQMAADLEVWKIHLIQVLKDSPSKERKFLRWKTYEGLRRGTRNAHVAVENGELEVLPETSP